MGPKLKKCLFSVYPGARLARPRNAPQRPHRYAGRQGQEHLTACEGMLSPWLLYAQMHALLPAKQQQQSPLDMPSVPRRKWCSSRKREEMQTSLLIRPVQETHKDDMYPLSNRISFMSIRSPHMPCRRQDTGMSIIDFDDGEIDVVQHNSVRVSSSELFLRRSNPFRYQSKSNFLLLFRNALLCA
ncbi:uncharacterized protein [Triticum aestivum]|uniref:uncharacterized protein isoform X2 n=1 Tax=Triticum aestivum TaxID=4565 RepID=UPI001D008E61|nr:uncharacterized protein LOC123068655 isoform X2 [Triticum aestivum]